ncbi:MAG: YybH family protein [Bacteroidota bacterium]
MKNLFLLLSLAILAFSCKPPAGTSARAILDADRDFSAYSVLHGSDSAFMKFCADSAVLLRDNSDPLCGFSTIRQLMMAQPDTSFTLSWEPLKAELAASGELGYSYGIWTYTPKADTASKSYGTYVTVWKKTGGEWKWVLDTGNDGLAPGQGK